MFTINSRIWAILCLLIAGTSEGRLFFKKKQEVPAALGRSAIIALPGSAKTLYLKGIKFVDPKSIVKIVTDNLSKTDNEIETAILNLGEFESVKVTKNGNSIYIDLVEYPALDKIDVKVKGEILNKINLDTFRKELQLEKGRILTPYKIDILTTILRNNLQNIYGTNAVDVKTFLKKKGNYADLRIVAYIDQSEQITGIRFTGNKKLSTHGLKKSIKKSKLMLHPIPIIRFEKLSLANAEEFTNSIEEYARGHGYLDAKVQSIKTTKEKENLYLDVNLYEGEKYSIAKVQYSSDFKPLTKKLGDLIFIREGDIVDIRKIYLVKSRINSELLKRNLFTYAANIELEKVGTNKVNVTCKISKVTTNKRVGNISFKYNHKTKESFMRKYLGFNPGDLLNEASLAKAEENLISTNLFDQVKVIQEPDTSDKDKVNIVIEVYEAKQINLRLMASAGISGGSTGADNAPDVNGFFGYSNLLGRGISTSLDLGINPIKLQFETVIPSIRQTNLTYFFRIGIANRGISFGSLFSTDNPMDAVRDFLFLNTYPNIKDLVKDLKSSPELKQDKDLPMHSLPYGLDSHWTEAVNRRKITELNGFMMAGANLNMQEFGSITLSLGLNVREIDNGVNNNEIEEFTKSLNKVKAVGTKLPNVLSYKGSVIARCEKYDSNKKDEYIEFGDFRMNKKTGNQVVELDKLDWVDKAKLQQEDTFYLFRVGTPLNRFDENCPREKIEYITRLNYSVNKIFPRQSIGCGLSLGVETVLGTTQALKIDATLRVGTKLAELIELVAEATMARSFNSCYLDNYSPAHLGLCHINGPIELYSMNPLGGRSMFKGTLKASFDLIDSGVFGLAPSIALTVGSIWDCGLDAKRLPENLVKARGWPEHTLDIANNSCKPIVILTPGVNIKMGPVKFSIGFNNRISSEQKLAIVKPIDFSVSLNI